jgi:8-hydroxy-5-deazaflavin:NADPH oxidoreductase
MPVDLPGDAFQPPARPLVGAREGIMRLAILGTGAVGGTLGRRWAALGHEIRFGSRDPGAARVRRLVQGIVGTASAAGMAEAVAGAEVVVLATPYEAHAAVLRAAGDLAGRIVVDATNPLKPNLAGLLAGHDTSGAEELARLARGARIYKALNQTGWETMADPVFAGGRAVMFVAGDEPAGKATVLGLVAELGFEAVDAGGLAAARTLEPLALLWIRTTIRQAQGRDVAFGLLRR